jgi:hypothetical protein
VYYFFLPQQVCFLGYLAASSFYIGIRILKKHKLFPEVWMKAKKYPADEETLFA